MTEPNPDEDLDALFARQRAADHEQAPGFHAMRTRALAARPAVPPSVPLGWRWALAGTVALGLAVVTMLSLHPSAKAPAVPRDIVVRELDQIDIALQKSLAAQEDLTAWQAPTDFLLNPTHNENTP